MKIARFDRQLQFSIIALFIMGFWPSCILAQDAHAQMLNAQHDMTADQSKAGALLKIVRDSTGALSGRCCGRSGRICASIRVRERARLGAMGLHFVNGALVNSGYHRRDPSPDRDLRANRKWTFATDRRRLSRVSRLMERQAFGATGANGSAFPPFRCSQTFWAASLLHLACLGMEG
jgi:hypothetical protein